MSQKLEQIELYAWLGEDELGSTEIGIKQGSVPAGVIPLVSINREKVARLAPQMEGQAQEWGKRIKLCRFVFAEVISETEAGE